MLLTLALATAPAWLHAYKCGQSAASHCIRLWADLQCRCSAIQRVLQGGCVALLFLPLMLRELRFLPLWPTVPSHLMWTTPHLSQGCSVHVPQCRLPSPALLPVFVRKLCQVGHGLCRQPLETAAEVLVMQRVTTREESTCHNV